MLVILFFRLHKVVKLSWLCIYDTGDWQKDEIVVWLMQMKDWCLCLKLSEKVLLKEMDIRELSAKSSTGMSITKPEFLLNKNLD